MCVIIAMAPGTMIEKDALFNAVYNNWHSWGLVLRDGNGKTFPHRDCPEDGENNPELIYKMLDDNKDIERYLHLRHTTKGETSLENCQPFPVYNSDARQVYFFHNGTLSNFGTYNGKSDTKEFCEKVLEPSFLNIDGENGKGDYLNSFFKTMLFDKNWTGTSTALFVSNDLAPLRIGTTWTEKWTGIWVSNNSYFDKVIRGPEDERRKEAARIERANSFQAQTPQNSEEAKKGKTISRFNREALRRDPEIILALKEVWQDKDLDTPEGLAKLSFVTEEEWTGFVDKEDEYVVSLLLNKLATGLYDAMLTVKTQAGDLERCRKRIADHEIEKKQNV